MTQQRKLNGATRHGKKTNLYNVWTTMKQRCHNPKNPRWPYYGGKGIAVCRHWRSSFERFSAWAKSNGYKKGLTIERRNNNGHYSPANCKWATRSEQQNNKRTNRRMRCKGSMVTMAQAAKLSGVPYRTLQGRFRYGFTARLAMRPHDYRR